MNKTQIEDFAIVTWTKAVEKFSKVPAVAYASTPKVSFFDKGTTAGWAKYNIWHIDFNIEIAKRAGDAFKDTIIHEVAHMMQYLVYPHAKQAHGPEFRRICVMLGGSGSTKHSYNADGLRAKTVKRHVLQCVCTKTFNATTTTFNKIKESPRSYHCSVCGTIGKFTKIKEITLT